MNPIVTIVLLVLAGVALRIGLAKLKSKAKSAIHSKLANMRSPKASGRTAPPAGSGSALSQGASSMLQGSVTSAGFGSGKIGRTSDRALQGSSALYPQKPAAGMPYQNRPAEITEYPSEIADEYAPEPAPETRAPEPEPEPASEPGQEPFREIPEEPEAAQAQPEPEIPDTKQETPEAPEEPEEQTAWQPAAAPAWRPGIMKKDSERTVAAAPAQPPAAPKPEREPVRAPAEPEQEPEPAEVAPVPPQEPEQPAAAEMPAEPAVPETPAEPEGQAEQEPEEQTAPEPAAAPAWRPGIMKKENERVAAAGAANPSSGPEPQQAPAEAPAWKPGILNNENRQPAASVPPTPRVAEEPEEEKPGGKKKILIGSLAAAAVAVAVGALLLFGVFPGSRNDEKHDRTTQASSGNSEYSFQDEYTPVPDTPVAVTEMPVITLAPTEAPTDTPIPTVTQTPVPEPKEEITTIPTVTPTQEPATPEPAREITQAPVTAEPATPEPAREITQAPPTPEPATPPPTAAPQDSRFPVQAKTTVKKVNVRSMPDINSRKISVVKSDGAPVTLLEETADDSGRLWYRVRLEDGTEGYMMGEYLQAENAASSAEDRGTAPGSTAGGTGSNGLYGLAVQELVTRDGPSKAFNETGTYDLMGQQVKVLARAHDALSGTWWVKCEIPVNGEIRILWTNYFRFDKDSLPLKSIPLE